MKFKVILKTKNEEDLIELWIRYYSKLVGKENIVIFDNHSTSQKVLDFYKNHNIEVKSIDIPNDIHSYSRNKDFYGDIFVNYDWFAVLDTDEFLCSYKNGVFSAEGVLDVLKNSSHKALGSTWLSQMHLGDSIEYFRVNTGNHNKNYGKAIFGTSYERLKNVIYGHNVSCKDEGGNCDAFLDSNLFLLHLDRLNPASRIKNCLDMCLCSSSRPHKDFEKNKIRQEVNKELQFIKKNNFASEKFLSMDPPEGLMSSIHKLQELKDFYSDKYAYLKKYYGTESEYIRTNVINHYVFGEEYRQEIKTNKVKII
jgi:hypothetical protein